MTLERVEQEVSWIDGHIDRASLHRASVELSTSILIAANPARALELLMNSPALATVVVPQLGYAQVSAIVKQADKDGVPFVEAMAEKGLMDRSEVMDLLRKAVIPVR